MALTFLQKLRFLFGKTAPAGRTKQWLDSRSFRSVFHQEEKELTLRELHALLGAMIEQGQGEGSVVVELEYIEGQLCGLPETEVVSASLREDYRGHTLVLRPRCSLIYVGKESFSDIRALAEVKGPYT